MISGPRLLSFVVYPRAQRHLVWLWSQTITKGTQRDEAHYRAATADFGGYYVQHNGKKGQLLIWLGYLQYIII